MEIQRVPRHLDSEMVEEAYRQGVFPMADTKLGVITWPRPRHRAILPLDDFHVSRSPARPILRGGFEVTFDPAFTGGMLACAPRKPTRISDRVLPIYSALQP